MAAPAYESALIQSLRGSSPAGSVNPGIRYYANQSGPQAPLTFRNYSGMALNPQALSLGGGSGFKAKGGGGGGSGDGGGGTGGTTTSVVDDALINSIVVDPPDEDPPVDPDPIVDPPVDPDPVVDPVIDPVVDPVVDPSIDPAVGPEGPSSDPLEPVGPMGGGSGTPIFVSTLANDKPKTDASHWGAGGDEIYSDPDRVRVTDPVDLSNVRVVDVDKQPIGDASQWGKGSDVQSDPYSLGVLESDIDPLDTVGDFTGVNGSDRNRDNYTFGVLQSDMDPEFDFDLLEYLRQLGGGGNGMKYDEMDLDFI